MQDDGLDQVSPTGLNPSLLRARAKSYRVGRGLSLYPPTLSFARQGVLSETLNVLRVGLCSQTNKSIVG